MKLGILGRFEVSDDDGAVLALTPQLRRLAALLTVSDGASVSADRIAEHLADGTPRTSHIGNDRWRC